MMKKKFYYQLVIISTYTVTYNSNGATSGTAPTDSNNYYSGDTVTVLSGTSLSKSGFLFLGWCKSSSGIGTLYNSGDTFTILSNTTLYAIFEEECYVATVTSTPTCQISIDGIINGLKGVSAGSTVTGITTSIIDSDYELVEFLILPDNGASYRVAPDQSIIMPLSSITITPVCSKIHSVVKFTMYGYGSDSSYIGLYDEQSGTVTSTLSSGTFTPQTDNNLKCCWGNTRILNNNPITGDHYSAPRYVRFGGATELVSRDGSGSYNSPIYFSFGLSENESTYEPYGFEISELLTERDTRVTIVQGTPINIAAYDANHPATTNAVYHTMTLLYPTNIRCLVVPKT